MPTSLMFNNNGVKSRLNFKKHFFQKLPKTTRTVMYYLSICVAQKCIRIFNPLALTFTSFTKTNIFYPCVLILTYTCIDEPMHYDTDSSIYWCTYAPWCWLTCVLMYLWTQILKHQYFSVSTFHSVHVSL